MKSAGGEGGTALVITLILALAASAVAAALADATHELAADVRVRREALCARYAALAGLVLGPSPEDRAGVVDASVASLRVAAVLKAPGWCVYRSVGICGGAKRTIERTVPVAQCGS